MVVLSARRPSATFTGRPRLRDGRRPSFSPVGRYGRTPLVAARLKVSIVYCVFSILIQPPSTPSISKFHDGCPRCGVCAAFLEYFTFWGFFLHYLGLFLAAPTFPRWAVGLFLADLLNFGEKNNLFCSRKRSPLAAVVRTGTANKPRSLKSRSGRAGFLD